jgi:hypothetical protein
MDQLQEFIQEEVAEGLMDLQLQVHHFSFQVEQEDQEEVVLEIQEEVQIQEQLTQEVELEELDLLEQLVVPAVRES